MNNIFKEIKINNKIPTYKYLVDGEWQESRNRKLIDIFSPIDGSLLGRIQSVLPAEADIAITEASMDQPSWAETPATKRILILKNAANLVAKNKDTFINFLIRELGKTKENAEHEVNHTILFIKETIREFSNKESKITDKNQNCIIYKVPVGVVLCITPFNFPIYTAATKIIPALISGNSVILKPSVFGAISALHFAQIFKKAGIPDGVLNVITGKGPGVGRYLAHHDLINMISFTGSNNVGKEIAGKANIVHLVFELGGKDPAIVLSDADLDKAAFEIAKGAFTFAGQRCVAIKRVLVEKKVKDKFIEKLKQATQKEFSMVGDPRDSKTQMGPVISDRQADYLATLLNDALKKGAKIALGGKRFSVTSQKPKLKRRILELSRRLIKLRKGQGRYWQATILDDVKPNMKIAWVEQFGPILPILTVKNEKEAINLANASEYGLDAAIFTKDVKKAEKLARKLQVGQVFINVRPNRSSDNFPFTGCKNSGLGTQGIKYYIESTEKIKSIIE